MTARVSQLSEADAEVAAAFDAHLLLYHVPLPPARIRGLLDARKLRYARFDVIYHLLDHVTATMSALLRPTGQCGTARPERVC